MNWPRLLLRSGSACLILGWLAALVWIPAPCRADDPPASDTAASTTSGPPTPAEIGALRARVDHHVVRVRIGEDVYDIRGARFDAGGVGFDRGRLKALPRGSYYDVIRPEPLSSPIAWDRIDRITVRKPCGLRGAIAGSVVGTAAVAGVAIWAAESNVEIGLGAIVLAALPPIGAAIGGALGVMHLRSEPGWQRAAVAPEPSPRAGLSAGDSARGAVPTSPVPSVVSTVPQSLALGVLRDDIGRRAIRVSVGRERYEIRDARLEPSGIAFDAGQSQRLGSRARAGDDEAGGSGAGVSSPLGWDRIDRIEARAPSALRGATWGMALLPLVLLAMRGEGSTDLTAIGSSMAVGVPIGAVVGAGVGAFVPHSKVEWDRSTSTRE